VVGDLPSDFGEPSTNRLSAEQWTPTHATQTTATLTHMASCRPMPPSCLTTPLKIRRWTPTAPRALATAYLTETEKSS
jgi:hypothetical protein